MQRNPAERPTPIQLFNITKFCVDKCQNYVKNNPDRFQVYFRAVEINAMATSFYKETSAITGLQDVPFPIPDLNLRPPAAKRFHPYESVNLEFFEEPNNEFRNDRDQEEEIVDALRLEEYTTHLYSRRVDTGFDPDIEDSDDDYDEAQAKAERRSEKEARKRKSLKKARGTGGKH